MESSNLDSEHSEDLMRPPRALRPKRKRGSSTGEADKGNLPKKFCNEDALLKVNSDVIALAEKSFIDDLKKEFDFSDCAALKTSTPSGAENVPQVRKRRRGSSTGVDTTVSVCLGQPDVSYASEKSQAEETAGDDKTSTPSGAENLPQVRKRRRGSTIGPDATVSACLGQPDVSYTSEKSQAEETASDDKSLVMSGVADDSKPLERSGRRNKCTSARVLLGLEKRKSKETTGQPKDGNEKSMEVMSVDRKPRTTLPKVKKEVLPRVQHDVLSTSLEDFPEAQTSLFVERCSVVKPEWLKPFKLGWRREIVFRNTVKTPSSAKPLCDVYYFASDDTKLRSLPQIIDYLKGVKSTLTNECFTFTKCAIYKEPQEMVRAAAFSRGRLSLRTGLLSSNESSMKSFDEANDDALSQASSTGTNRQKKVKETIAAPDSFKADVSVKTEAPVVQVPVETPVATAVIDIKKEEVSPNAGGMTSVDETDKRQAVRAAATMALRTYMSHALRTVNNPLLQSGNVRPLEKDKTVSSKSPVATKSAPLQGNKHQLSRKSLSPVVNIRRLSPNKKSDVRNSGRPEENVRRRKGPPSAMNLAKLNAKRSGESYSSSKSQEPMTSKATKLKARALLSTAASTKPDPTEKSIRDLKKMSPLKKSTPKLSVGADSPSVVANSFEKINAAIKELMSTKDGQPSQKKLSKSSNQQVAPLPTKAPSKSKTTTTLLSPVVRILPKPDGKSNEKPALSIERKPSVTPTFVGPKQVESCLTETSRICGMDCPGRLGIPPTLPCATCMSLFHPECAGYTSHMYFTPQLNFTCWVCGKLNKELENTSYGLFKSENPTSETPSPSEASSRNQKKSSVVGKATPNGGNAVDDTNAMALSSPRVQQASNQGAYDAATVLDQPNVLHHSFSLSGISVEEVTVSCGPTAQLLVIPAALARHLNLSKPLTLLVDDKEVHVKPEQLKVSGVGLNITLPTGSVPDAFVEGPEKPLEFRVVSSAESGRQAVAVSLFERPLKLSSALEAFSTSRAYPTALPSSDSVGQSDSGATDSNESNMMACDLAIGVINNDKGDGNFESSRGQRTSLAKSDGSMTSGESKGEAVTSTLCEGGAAECKTVDASENMDVEEDLGLGKSESKTGISSEVNRGQVSESELKSTVAEKELSIAKAAIESPIEASLSSSLETGKEMMEETLREEPKTGVSMETKGLFPITASPVDGINQTNAPGEHSGGSERGSCGERTTNSKSPFAASTITDEGKENVKEREIEAVIVNSSAVSCDESHEGDGADTLKGNLLVSTETKEETKSSMTIGAVSSTGAIDDEETNASKGSTL